MYTSLEIHQHTDLFHFWTCVPFQHAMYNLIIYPHMLEPSHGDFLTIPHELWLICYNIQSLGLYLYPHTYILIYVLYNILYMPTHLV